MKTQWLTEDQITAMAEAALTSYEGACDWSRAQEAAYEFATDELGCTPSKSAVLLAVKRARLAWQGIVISVRKEVAT